MPTPHINATTTTAAITSRISRLDIKAPLVHANAEPWAYDHPAVAAYAGKTPDERRSANASPPSPGCRPVCMPDPDGGRDRGAGGAPVATAGRYAGRANHVFNAGDRRHVAAAAARLHIHAAGQRLRRR